MSEELTVAQAKENFAMAMENVSPEAIIKSYPLRSVAVAALGGVLCTLTSKKSGRFLFPVGELIYSLFMKLYKGE